MPEVTAPFQYAFLPDVFTKFMHKAALAALTEFALHDLTIPGDAEIFFLDDDAASMQRSPGVYQLGFVGSQKTFPSSLVIYLTMNSDGTVSNVDTFAVDFDSTDDADPEYTKIPVTDFLLPQA